MLRPGWADPASSPATSRTAAAARPAQPGRCSGASIGAPRQGRVECAQRQRHAPRAGRARSARVRGRAEALAGQRAAGRAASSGLDGDGPSPSRASTPSPWQGHAANRLRACRCRSRASACATPSGQLPTRRSPGGPATRKRECGDERLASVDCSPRCPRAPSSGLTERPRRAALHPVRPHVERRLTWAVRRTAVLTRSESAHDGSHPPTLGSGATQ